jgi:hypothetical protein
VPVLTVLAFPSSLKASSASQVGVGVSIRVGPPLLPVYTQPLCPGPGYIWEPGYWAYGDDGYYWVPGVWVFPPEVGLLWTPGYWGFTDGLYVWNAGYWGPVVGFYGGIDYGFGYPGRGFYGGYWRDLDYYYNTRVTNVNTTIVHNVYNNNVVNETRSENRVSFNGGPGGVQVRPTASELSATRQQHAAMTSEQLQHQRAASADRTMLAAVNHGRPDVAASPRPQALSHGSPAHNNNAPNTERPPTPSPRSNPPPAERTPAHPPTPSSRPAPSHPSPPGAPAPRPAPAHPNSTPSHPPSSAPDSRTATPHHPSNPSVNRSTPPQQAAVPHAERPATHAPAPKQVPHPTNPQRSERHQQPPQASPHPSPPHTSTPRASAPHASPNAHLQPTKPEHPQP